MALSLISEAVHLWPVQEFHPDHQKYDLSFVFTVRMILQVHKYSHVDLVVHVISHSFFLSGFYCQS